MTPTDTARLQRECEVFCRYLIRRAQSRGSRAQHHHVRPLFHRCVDACVRRPPLNPLQCRLFGDVLFR